jgi:hypothetical protein
MDCNGLPLDPLHVEVPLGASKIMSKPMVRSMRTMHLSCAKINTTSEHTKKIFHLTPITYEFDRVCPK